MIQVTYDPYNGALIADGEMEQVVNEWLKNGAVNVTTSNIFVLWALTRAADRMKYPENETRFFFRPRSKTPERPADVIEIKVNCPDADLPEEFKQYLDRFLAEPYRGR